jgi:hypothetical protein
VCRQTLPHFSSGSVHGVTDRIEMPCRLFSKVAASAEVNRKQFSPGPPIPFMNRRLLRPYGEPLCDVKTPLAVFANGQRVRDGQARKGADAGPPLCWMGYGEMVLQRATGILIPDYSPFRHRFWKPNLCQIKCRVGRKGNVVGTSCCFRFSLNLAFYGGNDGPS